MRGALDHLDHNPSSTTTTDSFHGTSISLFQIKMSELPASSAQKYHQLSDDYTTVPAVVLATASVVVPKPPNSIVQISGHLKGAKN